MIKDPSLSFAQILIEDLVLRSGSLSETTTTTTTKTILLILPTSHPHNEQLSRGGGVLDVTAALFLCEID